MRTTKDRCTYCDADKDLTLDHVPPKLLLDRPYPKNLITVPACSSCNKSFQKDDEYLRTMLCADPSAFRNPAAQFNLSAVRRALQRPEAKGFVEYLAKQYRPSVLVDPRGASIPRFELDKSRINKSGERLIRALHFHETKKQLPLTAIVRVSARMDLTPDDPDALTLARVFKTTPDWRDGSIGTAFSYLAAMGSKGMGVSFWLMRLYDFFFWAGTVDCRAQFEK